MKCLLQLPGQLSEHVGMVSPLLEACPAVASVLERAEAASGLPLARLMSEGPEAVLRQDREAAVSMVTADVMYAEALRLTSAPDVAGVAGHSVGYSAALVAAGCITLEAAIDVAIAIDAAIDRWMDGAGVEGAMGVVVGIPETEVRLVAERAGAAVGCVNTATQLAVSGERSAVLRALDDLRTRGPLAVHEMPMRKPMHSPMLEAIEEEVRRHVSGLAIADPGCRLISHLDGSVVRNGRDAGDVLWRQLSRPVQWHRTVTSLTSECSSVVLLECGPGDVLTRLARWIDRRQPARALSLPGAWTEAVGA